MVFVQMGVCVELRGERKRLWLLTPHLSKTALPQVVYIKCYLALVLLLLLILLGQIGIASSMSY